MAQTEKRPRLPRSERGTDGEIALRRRAAGTTPEPPGTLTGTGPPVTEVTKRQVIAFRLFAARGVPPTRAGVRALRPFPAPVPDHPRCSRRLRRLLQAGWNRGASERGKQTHRGARSKARARNQGRRRRTVSSPNRSESGPVVCPICSVTRIRCLTPDTPSGVGRFLCLPPRKRICEEVFYHVRRSEKRVYL